MKQRIWELDALRGSCVLGMVLVHLEYDAVELYGLIDWEYPPFFHLVKEYGGILFILISGICASFGSRPALRGATILACGLLCTLVTFSLEALGFLGSHSTIWFGILHCLGCSMLLWSFLRRLPAAVWAILGGIFAITGHFLLKTRSVGHPWLVFLGFIPQWFASPDYFPLLPFFGYFLLGAAAGFVYYGFESVKLVLVNFAIGAFSGILSFLYLPLGIVFLLAAGLGSFNKYTVTEENSDV